MSNKIERFIGVSDDKKQVTIVKITKPKPGYPGLFNIPEFELSD